jgi:RNA polymerase sigma-70 factor, ECF subfamily
MSTIRLSDDDTEVLLRHAVGGDAVALRKLLERHRERLKRMVALRLSSRTALRIDPSDVVQEALVEAAGRLGDYLRDRPMPFYPWLRRLVGERLTSSRSRLMTTEVGGASLEEVDRLARAAVSPPLPADSPSEATTPGLALLAQSQSRLRARLALEGLDPPDREILVMHYLEELSFSDVAAILGVDEGTVKMRHLRALQRIRVLIDGRDPGGGG